MVVPARLSILSRGEKMDKWTFERTATYLRYSLKRPEGISTPRWSAMIKQVGNVLGWGWIAQF
jgi:hypothetical protein